MQFNAKKTTSPLRRKSLGFGAGTWVIALVGWLALWSAALAAPDDADFLSQVKADTRWLDSYGTRQIGTAAHDRLQKDLLAKLREIPNVEVWTDEFPVVVPIDDKTSLEVTEGELAGQHAMFPIWPDGARLNTTPAEGIAGQFVYIADASFPRLPARGLHGRIAVMEMSAYAQYRRAFDFGAEAVIFVESAEPGISLPSQQSLYKPRYYVPAGPLADALRSGKAKAGKIVSQGHWQTVTARNIYVGVKPVGKGGVVPYAVVAPMDSMSRVLGVAPGADAALDCAIQLNVLRNEAAKPSRALLFGFVDAYHISQLGMRRMAAMCTITPEERTRADYDKLEKDDLNEYLAAQKELNQYKTAEEGFASLSNHSKSVYLPRLFKDTIGRDLLRLRELQGELRLLSMRTDSEVAPVVRQQALRALEQSSDWLLRHHKDELTASQIGALKTAQTFAVKELAAFNFQQGATKWDGLLQARDHAKVLVEICGKPLQFRNRVMEAAFSPDHKLTDEGDLRVARISWQQMADRVNGQVAEEEQRVGFFEPLDRQRGLIANYFSLDQEGHDKRVCSFVVGVDLSDCGILVGPGMKCSFNGPLLGDKTFTDKAFTKAIKSAEKRGDIWPKKSPERLSVNIGAIAGRTGGTDLGERATITSAASSFLLPGVTWVTDDSRRQRTDSPMDRFDQLDWDRISPQLPATRMFLKWLFTFKDFKPTPIPSGEISAKWRTGMGRVVDVSAGETVPRVPRRGFLTTFSGGVQDKDGIRRMQFGWTGYDGSFRIPLMCADVDDRNRDMTLNAFRLNELGEIVESLTTSDAMVGTRLTTGFSLKNKVGEQLPRAVTFRCTELNGPSFFDPRFLEALTQGSLLDASRASAPKRMNFSIDSTGQMWGLVEPGMRWQLTVRAGASGVRMALLNAIPDARASGLKLNAAFQRGFAVDKELPSIPSEISARDLFELNNWRVTDFRAAGIDSKKINQIRDRSRQSLEEATIAAKADDGGRLQRASVQALASEIRAYRAISDTGQDIVRGAIFLMLIMVPFSIAMERLLFACARITTQISAAVAIFTAMTLLLWSFHPAFRISAQPIVIVMAFVILAMSLAVISIVLSRFRASMREFQSALAEGSGARMGRGGLLGSAVFLGIANMRKRKMRTALTGVTLVLVTFALLCFSSASSYVDKKDFRLDNVPGQQPSVMVRRPTFGTISWRAVDDISNLLGKLNVKVDARSWIVPGLADANWRIWAINPTTGEQLGLRGALGIPLSENVYSGIDAVLPNWAQFAGGGGCYLPKDSAEKLGSKPGDRLVVRGRELILCGVYDPIQLEDKVKLLDGQRILPYDFGKREQDWINRNSQDAIEQENESASLQPAANNSELYLAASEVIILPTEIAREMGGDLRSIAVACDSTKQATAVANTLMETVVYPAYYTNDQGGVNVVVATPLIATPPRSIAVPLVIAALIIFTTMLNSVSERKKEIYVYASLGLAPVHIGALFVAEALTYGLMGAVFGYIAGQGTATVLTHFGWMRGVTLNYSGTAVINTMLLVQLVVVLAAFVPAIIAGRIASPSSETDWKVPEAVNGEITSTLPFTVSSDAAPGLIGFIFEYLDAHRDGILGQFDVDNVKLLPHNAGSYLAGIDAQIWLAPFDVGVRQTMRLTIEPPIDEVCDIVVRVRHETGPAKLWWRLNRPFFFELRRQLLGWRKVSPERMAEYIEQMQGVVGVPSEAGQ